MATYTESLRYTADITDLKAKLATISSTSSKTAEEVEGHGGRMSRGWEGFKGTVGAIGTAIGGLAIAGGAGLGALGAYGINAAADFQQTRIAFEGLLGDAKTADSFLRDMRDFAAKTPFELAGVLDAARQLMATGTSAENVIPVLTKIGNTAAALGVGEESIQGVVRALGQMSGKGKASAEELNQIGEAIPGFSAVKAIAEGMGITVAEAFKLMEQGALPADVAIGHILTGMEKFPGAAGAMDRQSRTLNGVISTLKDTFRNALIDGIEPHLPALARFGEEVVPMVGAAVIGLIGTIGGIVAAFRAVADVLLPVGAALVGSIGWLIDHEEVLIGVAAALAFQLVPIIYGWATAALTAAAANWALAAAWIAANAPAIALAVAIAALVAGVIWAYQNWGWFREAVDAAAYFLTDVLWPAIVTIIQWLGDHLIPIIAAVVGWLVDRLVPAFAEIWRWLAENIPPVIQGVIRFFGDLIAKIAEVATTAWSVVQDVTRFFGDLLTFFQELPGKLANLAGDVFGFLRDSFRDAVNFIIRGWNGLEFQIPGFDPPGPGPSFGGFTLGLPPINELAAGGVITRPTFALLGETARARPEIVAPAAMIEDIVGRQLARHTSLGGPLVQIGTFAGRDIATLDELERIQARAMFSARAGSAT